MKKSAFFALLKFCALALLSVNSLAQFTDMQITQTTKSKREKVAKEVLVLEKILDYDTFVFRLNAAVIAPCKLANVKFYDGSKCIKDKKELENFSKSYDKEIKKIFRPERNYYVLTLKNLGDRWLCEVSDESRILNKTLVKNSLALPTSKEYQKIEVKEDWAKKNPELEEFYKETDGSEGFSMAFDKGKQADLIAKINAALEEVKKDGSYDKLLEKYDLK